MVTPISLADARVLVVDDDVDAAEALGLILKRRGADVRLAHAVTEALVTLAGWTAVVVVTDIVMPHEDGYDLLREIRALPGLDSGVPVIALSAFGGDDIRQRALDAGFHSYLRKPVNLRELCQTIALLADAVGQHC
ncbi:MAG: response regulator [bacterium]